jgi:hypothetical protein
MMPGEDPLAGIRGIVWAMPISIALWVMIFLIVGLA